MKQFLVEYTHIEATTYQEWVEAADDQSAIEAVKENPQFTKIVKNQGIEMTDFKTITKGV